MSNARRGSRREMSNIIIKQNAPSADQTPLETAWSSVGDAIEALQTAERRQSPSRTVSATSILARRFHYIARCLLDGIASSKRK